MKEEIKRKEKRDREEEEEEDKEAKEKEKEEEKGREKEKEKADLQNICKVLRLSYHEFLSHPPTRYVLASHRYSSSLPPLAPPSNIT